MSEKGEPDGYNCAHNAPKFAILRWVRIKTKQHCIHLYCYHQTQQIALNTMPAVTISACYRQMEYSALNTQKGKILRAFYLTMLDQLPMSRRRNRTRPDVVENCHSAFRSNIPVFCWRYCVQPRKRYLRPLTVVQLEQILSPCSITINFSLYIFLYLSL
jgi:hypothetical protein